MATTAKLFQNSSYVCDVEIIDFTAPKQETIRVGPFLGNPKVEHIPGKIQPGQVIFRCPLQIGPQLITKQNVELEIGGRQKKVVVSNVQMDVVTAQFT